MYFISEITKLSLLSISKKIISLTKPNFQRSSSRDGRVRVMTRTRVDSSHFFLMTRTRLGLENWVTLTRLFDSSHIRVIHSQRFSFAILERITIYKTKLSLFLTFVLIEYISFKLFFPEIF